MLLTIDVDPYIQSVLRSIASNKGMSMEQATTQLLERMLTGIPRKLNISRRDYKPQHIPVMIDETADKIKKKYRCNSCGNTIFEYYGSVKLITHGRYDANQNIIDGDEVDWFSTVGIPTEYVCAGRVIVQNDDGSPHKVRCSTVYYKIGV